MTTYEYDEAGNRIHTKLRSGREEEVDFDVLNRPATSTILGTSEIRTWDYDQREQLSLLSNPDVSYAFVYDTKDRLFVRADSRFPTQAAIYQYDAADRLERKIGPLGDVTEYLRDETGRIESERNTEYLQATYQYDGAGRVLTRRLSSGARTQYAYDAAGRLQELSQWTADGTLLRRTTYDLRDAVGNPKQTTSTLENGSVEVATFSYDPVHRLTQAIYTVDSVEQERQDFTYDDVGNRETKASTSSGLPTQYYIYNENNQLVAIRLGSATGSDHQTFEYDDNGNLRFRRNSIGAVELELRYDERDRVASAHMGAATVGTYTYDPFGYRIDVADTPSPRKNLLEGEHLEAIYDDTGDLVAQFLRGEVIDENVSAYFFDANDKATSYTYHHDTLQSVVGLSGHAGSVEETLRYAPFGDLIGQSGSSPNPQRFTGRDFDTETGLYYYRARYYDPELGRFLAEDPLGFDGGEPNLYGYVGNNPLRFNDPTGEIANLAAAGIGAGVGGILGGATAFIRTGNLRAAAAGALGGALGGGLAGLTFGASLAGGAVAGTGLTVARTALTQGLAQGALNAGAQAFQNDGRINLAEVALFTALGAIPGAVQGGLVVQTSRLASTITQPLVAAGASIALVGELRLGALVSGDAFVDSGVVPSLDFTVPGVPEFKDSLSEIQSEVFQAIAESFRPDRGFDDYPSSSDSGVTESVYFKR